MSYALGARYLSEYCTTALDNVLYQISELDFDRSAFMAAICYNGLISAVLINEKLLGDKRTCKQLKTINNLSKIDTDMNMDNTTRNADQLCIHFIGSPTILSEC